MANDTENLSESAQCPLKTASFLNCLVTQKARPASPKREKKKNSSILYKSDLPLSELLDIITNKCVLSCLANLSSETKSDLLYYFQSIICLNLRNVDTNLNHTLSLSECQ